jgi:hypothetical protein
MKLYRLSWDASEIYIWAVDSTNLKGQLHLPFTVHNGMIYYSCDTERKDLELVLYEECIPKSGKIVVSISH